MKQREARRVSMAIAILGCFASSFPRSAVAQGQAGMGLAVYIKFEKSPPAPVIQSMEAEVKSIVSPVGVPLDWRPLIGGNPGPPVMDLVVITFRGGCDPGSSAVPGKNHGALGWTYTSGDKVIPFADVDCDRVRTMLWNDLSGTKTAQRQSLFGRALGAVAAHEMYHMLTQAQNHGSGCLGKDALSGRELTDERCRFNAQEIGSIRAALSRTGHTLAPVGRSEGTAEAGEQIYH